MKLICNEIEIDLEKQIENKKQYLQMQGVKRNSIVAISLEDNLEIILCWFACEILDCVPLFLPIYYDHEMLDYIFKNIDVNYLIKENKILKITDEPLFDKYNIKPHYIIHTTSATEGMPKIVVRTDHQISSEIDRYIKGIGATSSDVILPLLPMYHSYGFLCGFMLAHYLDSTLILCKLEYPKKIINSIHNHNVTIMLSVPQIYSMILKSNHIEKLSSMKHVISSSAHLDDTLAYNFYCKYGHQMKQLLGSTETGSLAFSTNDNGCNVFDCIFDSVKFNVDVDGVLNVESYQTIGNYICQKSRIMIDIMPFCMGEKAKIAKNGYINIMGRNDKVLNFAGRKVSYSYLKRKVMNYNGIKEMKIVLIEKKDKTEIEYYILRNEKYDENEFISFYKQNIETWLQPMRIRYVSNIRTWKD